MIENLVATTTAITAVLSALGAVVAGIAAVGSLRLSRKIQRDLEADETLVVGDFHHPDTRQEVHRYAVLTTTIFNKSHRKAAITKVRLLDRLGNEIPTLWSDAMDQLGNVTDESQLLGVVDASRLYIRRLDGESIIEAAVEIHHTFPGSPNRVTYEMPEGWERWSEGG